MQTKWNLTKEKYPEANPPSIINNPEFKNVLVDKPWQLACMIACQATSCLCRPVVCPVMFNIFPLLASNCPLFALDCFCLWWNKHFLERVRLCIILRTSQGKHSSETVDHGLIKIQNTKAFVGIPKIGHVKIYRLFSWGGQWSPGNQGPGS
jgi:hypothetical protein